MQAILYNEELRKITEKEGLEGEDQIHFKEFEEIEETDKLNYTNLLLPNDMANALQNNEEEGENVGGFTESNSRSAILDLINDQKRLTDNFYEDLSTGEITENQWGIRPNQNIPMTFQQEQQQHLHQIEEEKHGSSQQRKPSEDFSAGHGGEYDEQQENSFKPSQMVSLWKNLKDLLLNQLKEEQQVVTDKKRKLQQQRTKFYKVSIVQAD